MPPLPIPLAVTPHALLTVIASALDLIGVGVAVCTRTGSVLFRSHALENTARVDALLSDADITALARNLAWTTPGLPGEISATSVPLDPHTTLVVVRLPHPVPAVPGGGTHSLSRREVEVAGLLARRFTNREIAGALGISVHTARHHAERVLHKLGVRSRTRVATALSEGNVSGR